ncbi:MAG: HAMP domain-containing sensor histidine kinase, partial [Bacteroidota bacterium]
LQFSFKDVSDIIQLEQEQTEQAEREALQAGKLEMATGILHDIGNAITAFGTHATKLDSDTTWNEIGNLKRLQGLLHQHTEKWDAVLGPGKGGALLKFMDALTQQLEQRAVHTGDVQKALLETTSHVQEILNIQRHYVKGNLKGSRAPVNIRQVLNDALSIQRQSLIKRNISLEEDIPISIPPISGDQTKLIQAVVNIIKNSAEAFDDLHEKSERHLRICVKADPQHIHLQFEDNACGFPSDQAAELFQKGHTSKASGTGFGLYNVLQIIESHAGAIKMESAGPGQGATTQISFPVLPE